jgi:hypothetical protein
VPVRNEQRIPVKMKPVWVSLLRATVLSVIQEGNWTKDTVVFLVAVKAT